MLTAVTASIVASLLLRTGTHPTGPTGDVTADNLDDTLLADVKELRAEVAFLRQRLAGNSRLLTDKLLTHSNAGDPSKPDPEPDPLKRHQAEVKNAFGRLEGRMAQEQTDDEWSSWCREKALDVLKRKLPDASLTDMRCGSSMCRLEITQPVQERPGLLASLIGSDEPFDSGTIYKYDDGGSKISLIVSRKGADLGSMVRE